MATRVPSPEPPDRFRDPGQRYRTLLEINNAIVSNLTRDALFHAIATAVRRVTSFDRAAVFLHDEARDCCGYSCWNRRFRPATSG